MQTLNDTQKTILTEAADRYHQSWTGIAGYLANRGLGTPEIVNGYLLGYVAEPEYGHEMYTGRMCIPYLTPSGVVDLKFRCLEDQCDDSHVKYLGLTGHEAHLYNVQALHDAHTTLYVTEGELDALTATVAGMPAVGISGASKWQEHYVNLFDDFQEIVILADGDEAGKEFADRIRKKVNHARIVTMPDDVNAYFAENGAEALREYCGA